MEVVSDRRYAFDADRPALWRALSAVEDYPRWWPWLRRFEARGLIAGDVWQCTVRPPVPYPLRFTIAIDDVVTEELVTATLAGDLVGTARLDVTDDGQGSTIRLVSRLAPASPVVRGVALVARPLARFGHDWVLRTGFRQFNARALA